MKIEIAKHLTRRIECPFCHSKNLSEAIPPHANIMMPVLPVCVDTPKEEDEFAPMNICLCEDCGLITLKDIVDPEVLYKIFHADGIGKLWEGQYNSLFELIKKYHKGGRLLEIGAGPGKVIERLLKHYKTGVEVFDPLYFGPKENVVVHNGLFNSKTAKELEGTFDTIVSCHTLEHFMDYNEYFINARKALKDGGLLITTVPNQEYNFSKGFGNVINLEHTSVCTNLHWIQLYLKHGFKIKEISFYIDYAIQIVGEKTNEPAMFEISDLKEYTRRMIDQFGQRIIERINKVKTYAKPDKENWLFGASLIAHQLFAYGLDEKVFKGVLDNSPPKQNKRLYGTDLICRKPEDIIKSNSDNIRIFLNVVQFNQEVYEQIRGINKNIECVFL
ncbi:MAG: methyltransferase domain-containing protein [Candidatus Pacearchaeota archaeon]